VVGDEFFLSAKFFRRKFWRAHLLMRRKFSAVQEHCPPEKLFAAVFSSSVTSSSNFVHRLKSVATKWSLLKQA